MDLSNPRAGKLAMTFGVILLILGCLYLFSSLAVGSYAGASTWGPIILTLGLILYLGGRFRHWWHWK